MKNPHGITLGSLHQPIKELYSELETEKIIYNLTHDILFGAIFSEIVKDGV